jgi:hypothetical protein
VDTGFFCTKPRERIALRSDGSAGEGGSQKITLKQEAKAKRCFNLKLFRFSVTGRSTELRFALQSWHIAR